MSLRRGPSAEPFRKHARQEAWFRLGVAAKALGGAAWDLDKLPEPDRTFWYHRGLLQASSEVEAYEQDELDRQLPQ